MAPALSVVVVTFNDLAGLERTLRSLVPITSCDAASVEVLIVDGGTPDIHLLEIPNQATLISEPDSGIYDAMNKGLGLSKGDHIWFLNGGDESLIQTWPELSDALVKGAIVMASYELAFERHFEPRASRGEWYISHALPTSHQAIFYPGEAARSIRYDLTYRISADYQFTAQLMGPGRVPVVVTHLPVARFYAGGTSLDRGKEVGTDAARVQKEILKLGKLRRTASMAMHRLSLTRRRLKLRQYS